MQPRRCCTHRNGSVVANRDKTTIRQGARSQVTHGHHRQVHERLPGGRQHTTHLSRCPRNVRTKRGGDAGCAGRNGGGRGGHRHRTAGRKPRAICPHQHSYKWRHGQQLRASEPDHAAALKRRLPVCIPHPARDHHRRNVCRSWGRQRGQKGAWRARCLAAHCNNHLGARDEVGATHNPRARETADHARRSACGDARGGSSRPKLGADKKKVDESSTILLAHALAVREDTGQGGTRERERRHGWRRGAARNRHRDRVPSADSRQHMHRQCSRRRACEVVRHLQTVDAHARLAREGPVRKSAASDCYLPPCSGQHGGRNRVDHRLRVRNVGREDLAGRRGGCREPPLQLAAETGLRVAREERPVRHGRTIRRLVHRAAVEAAPVLDVRPLRMVVYSHVRAAQENGRAARCRQRRRLNALHLRAVVDIQRVPSGVLLAPNHDGKLELRAAPVREAATDQRVVHDNRAIRPVQHVRVVLRPRGDAHGVHGREPEAGAS